MQEHAVSTPTAPFRSAGGAFEVHQIPVWVDNFSWVIVCTKTGQALVVDGPEAEPVLEYCQAQGIDLRGILNTHTHMDHVGINHALLGDARAEGFVVYGPARKASDVPLLTEAVDEGATVRLGAGAGQVMLTEGHIDGHVSYLFEDLLFCGDTLFGAGCGYLFDGPPEKMHTSLQRLAQLDEQTRVCCAHEYTQDNLRFAWTVEPDNEALRHRIGEAWSIRGEGRSTVPSTIRLERETNPFIRTDSESIRAAVAAAMPDRTMDSPAAVFAATRALKDRKDYRSLTDADLPL